MDAIDDLFRANLRALRQDLTGKRGRLSQSLSALPDQGSPYGQVHTRLIDIHDRLLKVVAEYDRPAGR